MEVEELIKTIKSKRRKIDIISYRQAFMLILYRRGIPGPEIARLLRIGPPEVHKCMRVICDRLDTKDPAATKAYYELTKHCIAIMTENALVEDGRGRRKVICNFVKIDGINFEI